MKYLLDVNALLALGFLEHEFHQRMTHWLNHLASGGIPELASTAITELGFVRILCQAPQYGLRIDDAQTLLARLKTHKTIHWSFLSDDLGVERMPRWVKSPKQLADGHLAELAHAHGMTLATFDSGIPGVFVIPCQ